ncbi:MAG: hypothetical protein H0V97_01935 [Actinobacteria bacterium]|nr:hypothetical protein [Actinomycetota bacterium]
MIKKTVALTVCLLLISAPAFAAHKKVRDANDVDGLLDLRAATVYGAPRIWNLKTYNSWTPKAIRDKGFLLVYYDTFGDERYDYYALLRSTGNRMQGTLWRDRVSKSDYRVSFLETWRSDKRSAKVRVPLGRMRFGTNRDSYKWYAQTIITGPSCKRTCFDRAPNRKGVTEPLGG